MKEELCRAFCDGLRVREMPSGLAIATAFRRSDGDAIGFYILGPDPDGLLRMEDDGFTLADLEAMGADLDAPTRRDALHTLLAEHGAEHDEAAGTLAIPGLARDRLPAAALGFVALLLRVQDLLLTTPERVASSFREDAIRAVRAAAGDRAQVEENAAVHPALEEYPADLVLRAGGHPPVAVFLAASDLRVSEALLLQLIATHEAHIPCGVVALLQRENAVTRRMRQRAANRLAAVPIFEGDEHAAATRIAREALGSEVGVG